MAQVVWQQFSFEIPDEWEMLQFSKNSKSGNCAFADRYMFRLETNWKTFEGWPDFERMLSDYQQKLRDEQSMTDFESATYGAWHGFHCRDAGGWTSRFGRYFEPNTKLLEVVFLWPDSVDRSEIRTILGNVKLDLPKNGVQHWRAFGMDFYADERLYLDECKIKPALAEMTFVDKDRPARVECFERLGMVEEWMRCSVEEWMQVKDPKDLREREQRRRSHAYHTILEAQARMPAMRFPKFNKRKNQYEAAGWLCPEDGRLYRVSRIFPAGEQGLTDLAGKRLACCPKLKAS